MVVGVDPELFKELKKSFSESEIAAAFSNDPLAQKFTVRYRRGENDFTSPVTTSNQHQRYVEKGWVAVAA